MQLVIDHLLLKDVWLVLTNFIGLTGGFWAFCTSYNPGSVSKSGRSVGAPAWLEKILAPLVCLIIAQQYHN